MNSQPMNITNVQADPSTLHVCNPDFNRIRVIFAYTLNSKGKW